MPNRYAEERYTEIQKRLAEIDKEFSKIELEVGVAKAFKHPSHEKLTTEKLKLELEQENTSIEIFAPLDADPVPGKQYHPSPPVDAPSPPQKSYAESIPVSFVQGMEEIAKILEDTVKGEAEKDWDLIHLARKMKTTPSQLRSLYQKQQQGRRRFEPVEYKDKFSGMTEQREWLIAAHISASTTHLLFADGGVGKTLLAYDICKAIATGSDWNGFPTKQGKVLIVQTDEPEIDTCERLKIADFDSIPDGQVYIASDWQFSQIGQLRQWIEKEKPAFVMIDSLTSANRAAEDHEKDTQYGSSLYDLRDIANDYGCGIMVLHHENKLGGIRGNTAIKDNVSEVWRLRRPDAKENLTPQHRIIEFEKSRSGLSGSIQVYLNVDDYSWQHQGDLGAPIQEGQNEPLTARLLKYLVLNANVRFEPEELVHEFGGNKEVIRKTLERHRKKGLLQTEDRTKGAGFGATRYKVYFCPKQVVPAPQESGSQSEFDSAGTGAGTDCEKDDLFQRLFQRPDLAPSKDSAAPAPGAGTTCFGHPQNFIPPLVPAPGTRVRVRMDGSIYNGQMGMVQKVIEENGRITYLVSFTDGRSIEYSKEHIHIFS